MAEIDKLSHNIEDKKETRDQMVTKMPNIDHENPNKGRSKKKPRRILHFSDGILEEYSTDDDEEKEPVQEKAIVDPRTLRMVPWLAWLTMTAGSRFVTACDSAGEKLAWWLGITSPKYYYEIQEAEKIKAEEEERKKREDIEMAGWRSSTKDESSTVVSPPQAEPSS